MRALTVCQPFASLIAEGFKRCENRTWHAERRFKAASREITPGELAIHSGLSTKWGLWDERLSRAPLGGIVAVVELVAIVRPDEALRMLGPEQREFIEGPWCWILQNPRPCWLPMKGQQGLWSFEDVKLTAADVYEWAPCGWLEHQAKLRGKPARRKSAAVQAPEQTGPRSLFG